VDDNSNAAEGLAMLCRRHGHSATVGANGVSALAKAANFRPHAAILDIGLPGVDGYELAGQLRKLLPGPRLTLVAYSATAARPTASARPKPDSITT
jgi:CheY-like chemotaxis protein